MKLKVLVEFRDKNDHKTMYKVGQIIEVADHKRAANLVSRDLCDFVEDAPVQQSAKEPAKDKTPGKGGKGKNSKTGSEKNPDEGAAGDAPEAGSESDNGVEQNPDQE